MRIKSLKDLYFMGMKCEMGEPIALFNKFGEDFALNKRSLKERIVNMKNAKLKIDEEERALKVLEEAILQEKINKKNEIRAFIKERMEECKLNRNKAYDIGNKQLGDERLHVYNELGQALKEIKSKNIEEAI